MTAAHSKRAFRAARRAMQRGIGLIEILIALTIALFLLGGLFALFYTTRQTFLDQNQLAQLQDRERLAMTMIAHTVQQAGYWADPQTETELMAFPISGLFAAGQSVTGVSGTTSAGDTLSVRIKAGAGDGVLDCTGRANAGAIAESINTFSVDATNQQLLCSVNGAAAVPIVPGVQSLTVLYGVDTNADSSVDRYLQASDVTANGWWTNVQSVVVTMTFVNPLAAQPGQPATVNFVRNISLMNRS